MDVKWIQRLVQIMRGGEVVELELDDPRTGTHLVLKRQGQAPLAQPQLISYAPAPAPVAMQAGSPALAAVQAPAQESAPPVPAASKGEVFASPMVGTFYRSPSPEADAFVQPGSQFRPDTTLCIIEAMKVMNEIKAEQSGTILEVLIENGTAVEFGQPLFLVKKG